MRIFVIPMLLVLGALGERVCKTHDDCKGRFPIEWCHGVASDGVSKKCVIKPPIPHFIDEDHFALSPSACSEFNLCKHPQERCINGRCSAQWFSDVGNFPLANDVYSGARCTTQVECKDLRERCEGGRCVADSFADIEPHHGFSGNILSPGYCSEVVMCRDPRERCVRGECVSDSFADIEPYHNFAANALPPLQNCTQALDCKNFPREWCIEKRCVWRPPGSFAGTVAPSERICKTHEDCKGRFPVEWCNGVAKDGVSKKCVIRPPIPHFSGVVGHSHDEFVVDEPRRHFHGRRGGDDQF